MGGFHILTPVDVGKALWQTSSQLQKTLRGSKISPQTPSQHVLYPAINGSPIKATDLSVLEESGLMQLMREADTLEQYQACAERLDTIQGHNDWKRRRESCEPEYDPIIIEEHIKLLEEARNTSDVAAMQHLLRTTLSRDLGGMNTLRLYKHSWAGTKLLIEDYIACVLSTIEKFAESAIAFNLANSEVQFYLQSLEDALKYFGRSALTLSGGGTLGMKHIGIVKTLWEADLLPEIISGASAGSIIAAVVGVSSDDEISSTLNRFPASDLACFDPPGTGSLGWARERILSYLYHGNFFQMNNMERVMKDWMGDITFREAHNKTQRVLNICVSSAESDEPRLLNHLTAPDVLVWSAVCASCSVPNVFPSANVYEKDPETKEQRIWMAHAKQMFVDGSLDHDIPMRKLSEMFNVNFFIVSQVNPHVRMFLQPEEEFAGVQHQHASMSCLSATNLCFKILDTVGRETLHRAQQLRNIGFNPPQLRWASVLSQKYTGDINILPAVSVKEMLTLMSNPTPEFMLDAEKAGERATWPKIYRIKNCVAIELGLIRAIHTLKERINFGPEAKAAREASHRSGRGRSYSITGERPGFLRGRSLSNENIGNRKDSIEMIRNDSSTSLILPISIRRNQSLGALDDRLSSSDFLSQTETPLTSPGMSPGLTMNGKLSMTSVISHDGNPYFKNQAMNGYY